LTHQLSGNIIFNVSKPGKVENELHIGVIYYEIGCASLANEFSDEIQMTK
jgi:hypothetical protein